MAVAASAMPSTSPIVLMLTPSTVAMNTGSRLCTSSEDTSMNSDPKPSAQMPAGSPRLAVLIVGSDRKIDDGRAEHQEAAHRRHGPLIWSGQCLLHRLEHDPAHHQHRDLAVISFA